MATSTARGTASSKTSGTTLTIPSFTVPSGQSLKVPAGYDNAAGHPTSVVHANRVLKRRVAQDDAVNGFAGSIWLKGKYNNDQTGTCVLTWSSAIGKRAALARSWDEVLRRDGRSSSLSASSTQPGTGQTGTNVNAGSFIVGVWYEITTIGNTDWIAIGAPSGALGTVFQARGVGSGTGVAREALSMDNDVAYCAFVAEGPLNDLPGTVTARIEDGNTWQTATLGQSAGTNGAPPASNIYIIESFLTLTARHTTRGQLQSATSRNWIGMMLALRKSQLHRVSISPADLDEAWETADGKGTPIPHEQLSFFFNEAEDRWEVRDRGADLTGDTLVSYYIVGEGWVEV